MKKLHSLAFYTLVTPVLTFGAGSALAHPTTGPDKNLEQQSSQRDQGATQYTSKNKENNQSTNRTKQSEIKTVVDHQKLVDQTRKQNRGYMNSAPANGMQASNLIGTEVKTSGGEDVGPVDDLIIDENGQVVAIVIGAGGFLGMGEKDVAIGWDHVTRSGTSDKQELRIDVTREGLMAAPEYKTNY